MVEAATAVALWTRRDDASMMKVRLRDIRGRQTALPVSKETGRRVHRLFGKWSIVTLSTVVTTCGIAVAAEGQKPAPGEESMCLAWDRVARADCPLVEEVAAAIRETLGRPLAWRGTCDTQVTGVFRADSSGGWSVALHFASQSGASLGDRSLEIRDAPCSALKEPLALVIALMVEGKSSDKTALRLRQPRSSRPDEGNMTAISVGGALSSGLTGDVGLGATMGVASRALGGWPLRLETTFWFPTVKAGPGPAGEFWAWLGGVGFCPSLFKWKQLVASGCAHLVAGIVRGVGRGLDEIEVATRPLGAVELTAQLSLRLSQHASIYLGLGAATPWVRARFVYHDALGAPVAVHEPGLLIPVAELGIELGSPQAEGRPMVGEP